MERPRSSSASRRSRYHVISAIYCEKEIDGSSSASERSLYHVIAVIYCERESDGSWFV